VLLPIAGCVFVVVVVAGGRASDAVDDNTGVAIEEESAGEEGVAAAAAPNPNKVRGGRETSFSFSLAGADDGGCLTMGRGVLARTGMGDRGTRPTMDVIGFIDTLFEATAVAAALVCAALGEPLPAAGRDGFACLDIGVGDGVSVGVAAPEPEPALAPALAPALESTDLAAFAHIAATDVTRPPRPPRADLTSYFTST
jgi:hypothetical protein